MNNKAAIARCPYCGNYCAAVALSYSGARRVIEGWRREGLEVRFVTAEFVRQNYARCTCVGLPLFAEAEREAGP